MGATNIVGFDHLKVATVLKAWLWNAHGLAFARRPVEVVSKLLTDFAKTNRRMIGGRPHDLAISPDGQYFSSTGDAKSAV